MNRNHVFVLVIFLLSACRSVAPSTVTLPEDIEPMPFPSATFTASPLPTVVTPSVTLAPTTTPDPKYFRDDFMGTLDPQWHWVREDPLNWSLITVPGSLQINVGGGYVTEQTNFNLLLRPAPTGNFQIETQITFKPQDNFQFAGLIIYESEANFIQAGRGYCRTYACIGEGLYMNYYRNRKLVQPDFAQPYKRIDPILIRLSRRDNTYSFEANTDGKVWFIIGSHTSEMNPLQIGLVTGQKLKGEVLPATFEYFEVRSLP
jgi:beta-xylosidase